MSRRKARVNKLYTIALRPAVSYGSMANGLSETELKRFRAAMLKSRPVYNQLMSTRRVLAIQGDPAWKEAVAPARAWAILAWNAQINHRCSESGLPTLLEIINWAAEVMEHLHRPNWKNSPFSSACRLVLVVPF